MKKLLIRLRQSGLVTKLRSLVPDLMVNYLYHLPLAVLANLFYSFPARHLKVIGITGTKGKTSTAHLLYHVLSSQPLKVSLISTVSAKLDGREIDTGLHVTNPNPFALQKLIKKMVGKGCQYLVLEVTSHGLAQFRDWGINFELGIITNIYSDHLDYHRSLAAYRQAKVILLRNSKKILLNFADPSYKYLIQAARKYQVPAVTYRGKLNDFVSQNRSAALAAASALGLDEKQTASSLNTFPGVTGRMETIQTSPFQLVIDFAHTPESLAAALRLLRKRINSRGRLIAVFGCAGERDPGRRRMGKVAASLSDLFIITAEDPRSESLPEITKQVAGYARQAGARPLSKSQLLNLKGKPKHPAYTEIPDRKQAITFAVDLAKPGDLIGLFGKGHEKSLCFGTIEYPWSEHAEAIRALKNRK